MSVNNSSPRFSAWDMIKNTGITACFAAVAGGSYRFMPTEYAHLSGSIMTVAGFCGATYLLPVLAYNGMKLAQLGKEIINNTPWERVANIAAAAAGAFIYYGPAGSDGAALAEGYFGSWLLYQLRQCYEEYGNGAPIQQAPAEPQIEPHALISEIIAGTHQVFDRNVESQGLQNEHFIPLLVKNIIRTPGGPQALESLTEEQLQSFAWQDNGATENFPAALAAIKASLPDLIQQMNTQALQ